METDLTTVSDLIADLDEAGQREVLAELSYRWNRQLKATKADRWSREELQVYAAIEAACDGPIPPLDIFSRRSSRVSRERIKNDFKWLNEYVTKSCQRRLTVTEHGIVLRLVIDCLVSFMRDTGWDRAMRPETLILRFSSIKAAVDAAFPGYAACKLLDRVALMTKAA
jgi:hypothetical protein